VTSRAKAPSKLQGKLQKKYKQEQGLNTVEDEDRRPGKRSIRTVAREAPVSGLAYERFFVLRALIKGITVVHLTCSSLNSITSGREDSSWATLDKLR
jgi:hypothetical protein